MKIINKEKRKVSIAQKNIMILVLSFIPFVVGLSYSLSKRSTTKYLSKAINFAGSQRMRTMLIANYSHQLHHEDLHNSSEDISKILEAEIKNYKKFYYALINGDEELDISKNPFTDISQELDEFELILKNYLESSNQIIFNTKVEHELSYVLDNAMKLKNHFHEITEMFQNKNDKLIVHIAIIDFLMLLFALIITIRGFFLSSDIRKQEVLLIESKKEYQSIIKKSRDAIVICDSNKLLFVNEPLSKMLGFSKPELLTMNLSKIFDNKALANVEKNINNMPGLETDKSISFDSVLTTKKGDKLLVEIAEKIINYKGKKSRLLIIRDVSKLKELIDLINKSKTQSQNLDEFIQICANCKSIQDNHKLAKSWVSMEEYFSQRLTDINFSHGICPDCVTKLYPELGPSVTKDND